MKVLKPINLAIDFFDEEVALICTYHQYTITYFVDQDEFIDALDIETKIEAERPLPGQPGQIDQEFQTYTYHMPPEEAIEEYAEGVDYTVIDDLLDAGVTITVEKVID